MLKEQRKYSGERAAQIRCERHFKGGPGAHSADKGEERGKEIPTKGNKQGQRNKKEQVDLFRQQ